MTAKRPISEASSPVLRGSWAALQRAGARARRVAAQSGTAVVIFRDGKLEYIYPPAPSVRAGVHEDTQDYGNES
ncbi:MAG: hypothetical protein ACRESR_09865 [Gammaproteobacteria bacterium]